MKRIPRPIKSDMKSKRIVWDEERAIRWPYYKILREHSNLKQFYPDINPYVEVYKMRDNLYCCFWDSLDGAGDVWSYIIDGPEKALAIDTGFGIGDYKALIHHLVGDKELIVVNTHSGVDHCFGNPQFDRVYCSKEEVYRISKRSHAHNRDYLFNEDGSCKYTEFDREDLVPYKDYELIGVEDGHLFDLGDGYQVELVLLPGHSPGQSAFLDHHHKIIFTGDTGSMSHRQGDEPYGENCCVEALYDALVKLEPRIDEIEAVFPGHGMLDQTAEVLRYLKEAAQKILDNPLGNCDSMQTRTSTVTGETTTVMQKYIHQGSAIRYTKKNVYRNKVIE